MRIAGKDLLEKCLALLAPAMTAFVVAGWLAFGAGCMTPERARRETEATGVRLATECWQRQTGSTNTFDLARPSDALALRIALLATARGEEGQAEVVFPKIPQIEALTPSNGTLTVTLGETLCIAARNDRGYQNHKDAIFNAALDLDYQQFQFDTTFSGMLLALLSGTPEADRLAGQGAAGAARRFESGAEIAGSLAVDVVSLLRDNWRSLGLNGDLTMSLPLLRGSGREIVREPLTQAERNLLYALENFEHYRQAYAVEVAQAYFKVLESFQLVRNAEDNERNLLANSRRADMLFDAGRMARIQVDQAQSELLTANKSLIDTRKNYENALDALKIKIGLPPESRIEVDLQEAEHLGRRIEKWAAVESAVGLFPAEDISCEIALAERRDLLVQRCRTEDAERAVRVAADALRADVTLTGKGHLDRARASGQGKFDGIESWSAGARVDMPWNRRRERNQYRKQILALEQARRGLEQQEDGVKQAVRAGLRNLVSARQSYLNRVEALKVARRRVESNTLFLQSGRSEMRDVLEAEKALLGARNALSSDTIYWQMSDLELRRDMGILKISESGTWLDGDGNDNG